MCWLREYGNVSGVMWWQRMSLSDQLAVVGLLLSVAGFAVTIWQLLKTRDATQASSRVMQETEKRLRGYHLLGMINSMRNIETDIDTAVDGGDRSLMIRSLVALNHTSSTMASYIGHEMTLDDSVSDRLKACSTMAAHAKGEIVGEDGVSLKEITRVVRSELSDLNFALGVLAGSIQSQSRER